MKSSKSLKSSLPPLFSQRGLVAVGACIFILISETVIANAIAAGGPVTVTDRRMTRYFMNVQEAVSLVLSAAELGGGKVYTLDMGKPVSILKLAEDRIKEAGWRPYRDIGIVFTGVRPGEKLEEELGLEMGERVGSSKIFAIGVGDD